MRLEATAGTSGPRGRPRRRAEPCPGSAPLSVAAPCRLNDENSRAKFQNVRGDSSAIRWREIEIAPDGTRRKVLRYEALGEVTRKQASEILSQRMTAVGNGKAPRRSSVTFQTLAGEWDASVLPMYKHSTQKHRRFMVKKHLLPRFGNMAVSDVTRQEIQAYVAHLTQAGYTPKSIDHIHDVLSAILRTAVKWGHLQENPARGVDLPTLRCVRPSGH